MVSLAISAWCSVKLNSAEISQEIAMADVSNAESKPEEASEGCR